MTQATPKYDNGDRVEIPHIKSEAEVVERRWSDANESWIYSVNVNGDMKSYQEKNIRQ